MKFAILLPGPSLKDTWRGGDYAHVVAVTGAIHAEPKCDIWVVAENPAHKHQGRYKLFAERFFQIRPTIWTLAQITDRWVHKWDVPADHPIVGKGMQQLLAGLGWPMKCSWAEHVPDGSSFFRAVFGALDAGATELHIYGHDMDGHADFNPATGEAVENKKPEELWDIRWKQEKAMWQEVGRSLTEAGVKWKEGDFGTSSPADPPVSTSEPATCSKDRQSQSTERFVSEIERLSTYGHAGIIPSDSSTSESTPTSTLPSSFGSARSDSEKR